MTHAQSFMRVVVDFKEEGISVGYNMSENKSIDPHMYGLVVGNKGMIESLVLGINYSQVVITEYHDGGVTLHHTLLVPNTIASTLRLGQSIKVHIEPLQFKKKRGKNNLPQKICGYIMNENISDKVISSEKIQKQLMDSLDHIFGIMYENYAITKEQAEEIIHGSTEQELQKFMEEAGKDCGEMICRHIGVSRGMSVEYASSRMYKRLKALVK